MRRSRIFWGLVLILAAILMLLKTLEIIQDFFGYFWVFAIFLIGVWLIVGAFTHKSKKEGEKVTVSLEGATSATIKLDYGAGRLNLHSGATPGLLIEGLCAPGSFIRSTTEGDNINVRLKSLEGFWAWAPGDSHDWDLSLAHDLPINLDIDSGANTAVLDLHDLKVIGLDLDTGASTTDVTLPANAGLTRVKVDSGASTVCLRLPEGVSARIRIESGLASVHVAERFPKSGTNLYLSPDYDTAANRAEITIEMGLATIEIL